jgi:hypothetical protein
MAIMPPACRTLKSSVRTALLLFTLVGICAGGIFPALSSNNAAASSWSYYGNFDYTRQKSDAGNLDYSSPPQTDASRERGGAEQEIDKDSVSQSDRREQNRSNNAPTTNIERHFDSYDVTDPKYADYLTRFKYVLYYGGFDSNVKEAIIAVKPTLLVTNYQAIDQEMRSEFAENDITVIAYLPIHWTDRSLDSTLQEAKQLLRDGADGLFIDEAATVSSDWEFWYHGRIYETAKEFDKNSVVIINPGSASISERAMEVSDIICFEHEWRDIASLEWASDYPGWRFMGISSNEFVKVMGYNVGSGSAQSDLDEARSLNIAYHYSADHYIWLPPWLDVYGGIAMSLHPVSDHVDLELNPVASPPDASLPDDTNDEPPLIEPEVPDTKASEANDTSEDEKDDSPKNEEPVGGHDSNEDDDHDTGSDPIEPSDENEAPRARAGQDQSVTISDEEAQTVQLDATASGDPDSDNLSFSWEQIEGPEVSLAGTKSEVASFVLEHLLFTESSKLEFKFRLTVTDTNGAKDSDSVVILASLGEQMPKEVEDIEENDRDAYNATESEPEPLKTDLAEENVEEPPDARRAQLPSNSTGVKDESRDLTEEESNSNNANSTANDVS